MARKSGTKNELVKCEYCGEMYSTTYRHCPFCNEDGTGAWNAADSEDEYEEDDEPRGGKRLASGGGSRRSSGRGRSGGGNRQGPSMGAIVGGVLSLLLIIAAVCIVFSIVRTLLGGDRKQPDPTPTPPIESDTPTPTPTPPVESETPSPQVTTPAVDVVRPTSFTLSKNDMTFFNPGEQWDLKVTMVPADATAEVTWKSSDPNIASVSWNGRVTAVSKGTVTVTATIEGVGEQTCIVRCNFKNAAATPQPTNTSNAGTGDTTPSGLTISRVDFTLTFAGDHWRLVVSGTESPVTWTSSNPAVATVAADGTVTAVSKGTCNVTAEVDGQTLTCIVRCNFKE